jgi:integrase
MIIIRLQREKTLLIDETESLEKVQDFLNQKAINSKNTKESYGYALSHFQTFLSNSEYKDYNVETIVNPLLNRTIDIYELLKKFIKYLLNRQDPYFGNSKLSPRSIHLYVAGVRTYFEYYDVEISTNKFKTKVTLPRKHKRSLEPIDAKDIRTMLLACTNSRLKVFLLILATTGMRANEAISLRNCDINFDESPTEIHLRAEITKTKQERNIYTTYEASKELKAFIDSKYGNKDEFRKWPDHLAFSMRNKNETGRIYWKLNNLFAKVLEKVQMNQLKDGTGAPRKKIAFHSFRRFVKTTISNLGYGDYSEWLIGHEGTMSAKYYNVKEQERRELYKKCMKYLTFLDYPTVEAVGKDFESKIQERDKQFEDLKKEAKEKDEEMQQLRQKASNNEVEIKKLQKEIKTTNQWTVLFLRDYFRIGVRNTDDPNFKRSIEQQNKENAERLDLARREGILKDFNIDDFHLAPDIIKHYKLDRGQNKKVTKKRTNK